MKWRNADFQDESFKMIFIGIIFDIGLLVFLYRERTNSKRHLLHCWIFDVWLINILVGEFPKWTDLHKIFALEKLVAKIICFIHSFFQAQHYNNCQIMPTDESHKMFIPTLQKIIAKEEEPAQFV